VKIIKINLIFLIFYPQTARKKKKNLLYFNLKTPKFVLTCWAVKELWQPMIKLQTKIQTLVQCFFTKHSLKPDKDKRKSFLKTHFTPTTIIPIQLSLSRSHLFLSASTSFSSSFMKNFWFFIPSSLEKREKVDTKTKITVPGCSSSV